MTPVGPEEIVCDPAPCIRRPETHANVHGQDALEYAMLLAVLLLAATAGMTYVATHISDSFSSIGAKVSTYTMAPAESVGVNNSASGQAQPRAKARWSAEKVGK